VLCREPSILISTPTTNSEWRERFDETTKTNRPDPGSCTHPSWHRHADHERSSRWSDSPLFWSQSSLPWLVARAPEYHRFRSCLYHARLLSDHVGHLPLAGFKPDPITYFRPPSLLGPVLVDGGCLLQLSWILSMCGRSETATMTLPCSTLSSCGTPRQGLCPTAPSGG